MKTIRNLSAALFAVVCVVSLMLFNACEKSEDITSSSNSSFEVSDARQGVVKRPFSDFTSTQTALSINWWVNREQTRLAYIDYTGYDAAYFADPANGGINFGTTITGAVSEIPAADGRAKVTVRIHVENGISYSFNLISGLSDFGTASWDLDADHSLPYALGTADVTFVFYNSATGAPIPDLAYVQEWISQSVHVSTPGVFHDGSGYAEGTLGELKMDFVGLYKNKNFTIPNGGSADAFPVEHINYVVE